MSPDPLEKNIARLVRQSALPNDEARQRRAREHFLRAAGDRPAEALGRRLAVAAAAILVCGLVFWAVKADRKPAPIDAAVVGKQEKQSPEKRDARLEKPTAGNKLQGSLNLTRSDGGSRLHYRGLVSIDAPGLVFQVYVAPIDLKLENGMLVVGPHKTPVLVDTVVLKDYLIDVEWTTPRLEPIQLKILAPDSAQDQTVLEHLKLKEADRTWTFEFVAWDERLLPRLAPQLDEVADFVKEGRDLVARCDAAARTEASFTDLKEMLIRDARGLQARAKSFAEAGLYPVSTEQVSYVARDLATQIPNFTWEAGKFQGPTSYYTKGKRSETFRQEPFEFETLKKYLDEAEVVAGREFGLWIVKDIRRFGLQDGHRGVVKQMEKRPGVAGFADRLGEGNPSYELVQDLCRIKK
jgi:hypothetical protein